MRLATRHVPLSSSKFSKRTFTQPQLIALYCLKLKLGATYRELIDWLAEMPGICKALGLKQLPHFTTVQKAFQRLSLAIWRLLQRISACLLCGDETADASGWDRSYASRYYTQRINLKLRALKTTLLVETGAQTVLDVHLTTSRKHDTRIGPKLTERNRERFETLVADKGYDDRTHRGRLKAWGKRPLIKHREFAPHDVAANARMDPALYHRRSLVEACLERSEWDGKPSSMVAPVSGDGGYVPGLQRGAGSEAGGEFTRQALGLSAILPSVEDFYKATIFTLPPLLTAHKAYSSTNHQEMSRSP